MPRPAPPSSTARHVTRPDDRAVPLRVAVLDLALKGDRDNTKSYNHKESWDSLITASLCSGFEFIRSYVIEPVKRDQLKLLTSSYN